jgi:hypothetical protein
MNGGGAPDTGHEPAGPMSGGDLPRGNDGADEAPSGGLISELASGGGGSSSSPGKVSSMRSTGVLIAVAICAGGVLFGMRHLGMNGRIAFAEKPIAIDYKVKDGDTLLDHERLMGELRASAEFSQVALRDIHMNPFIWKQQLKPEPEPVAEKPRAPKIDPWQAELQRRRDAIQTALSDIRLTSVIGQTALISGDSYRVGQPLSGGLFKIVAISGPGSQRGPSVTLEVPEDRRAEHRFFIITID